MTLLERARVLHAEALTWQPNDTMRGALGPLDRADPRLATAHHLLYSVRDACHDDDMRAALTEAMLAIQDARARLGRIERGARER